MSRLEELKQSWIDAEHRAVIARATAEAQTYDLDEAKANVERAIAEDEAGVARGNYFIEADRVRNEAARRGFPGKRLDKTRPHPPPPVAVATPPWGPDSDGPEFPG